MKQLFVNGKKAASLPAGNWALHGESVFTTLLSKEGVSQRWDRHLERLERHAHDLGLAMPATLTLPSPLKEEGKYSRLRVTILRDYWMAEFNTFEPPPAEIYNGVSVVITKWQIHPQLGKYKTGNYLPYLMAKREAEKEGAFEGLLVDANGHVVDGSRTSPLYYQNNTLYSLEGGLQGITREAVLAEAEKMAIRTSRIFAKASELVGGQLLLAGTGVGLVPVGPPVASCISELIATFKLC